MIGCDIMKKKVIIIVAVAAVIAVVAGFFLYPFFIAKDMQESIGVNFDSVNKVTIASGTTGKSFDIVGKENLQEFFITFKGATLKKDSNQKIKDGFIYSAILYKSDKEIVGFNFGYNQITVSKNGSYTRYISSKNIDEKQISEIAQKYKLNN
jgi:flagellar basal body-associated protein FliL